MAREGENLIIGIEDIELVQEVRFQGTDEKHYLVVPSSSDNELVVLRLNVYNQGAAVVQMTVDEEAAELRGVGPTERYKLLDLHRLDELSQENLQVLGDPHPSENLYVPFIAGPIELQQGLSVVGWVVFEVPEGTELTELRWSAGDTVCIPLIAGDNLCKEDDSVKVTPTPTPTPVPPAIVTSTTNTLVAAWGPPVEQPLVPWFSRGIDLHIYHIYERIIGLNHETGAEDPSRGLAERWTISPDGKDFTFLLRPNIPFHQGWGIHKARDFKHMVDRFLGDDSVVRDKAIFANSTVEVLGDYEFVIKQTVPDILSIPNHCSGKLGACAAMSKDFWDAEGIVGYSRMPISTGPWRFVSWIPGHEMLAERVMDHWRKTPEFEEYKLQFSAEPTTRAAMLLAGQAHMAALHRDLQKTFTDTGFTLTFSRLPALAMSWHFGGMHFEYEKLVAAGYDMTTGRNRVYPQVLDDAYFADSPWTDPEKGILIREAFNRAVNRQELNQTIFVGQGEPAYVWGMHSSLNGWSTRWGDEFDNKYGYDPVKARALLAQAGYGPGNPLKFSVQTYERFDFPDNIDHIEVMADYFEVVGIEVTLIPSDTATRNRQQRERSMQGQVEPFFGGYRVYQETMRPYHGSPGGGATYENLYTWTTYDKLVSTIDLAERAAIVSEVGDHMFYNFASIPLFWFRAPALLNTDVVVEYIFPGNSRRVYTHTEYIKAARTR